MNDKKEKKAKNEKADASEDSLTVTAITSKNDLKNFLLNIRDKMSEQTAAPVYAVTAMNHVLNLPGIYELLDKSNKEIARDIWLRLKQSGLQLRTPPMLFSPEEEVVGEVRQ